VSQVSTGQMYAMKVLKLGEEDTSGIASSALGMVTTEKGILTGQTSATDFLVHLVYTFQTPASMFLIMEYEPGGDLQTLIERMGFVSESWAKFFIAETLVGIAYLHERSIIHRDLKPANLLISRTGHIKLADFGLSTSPLSMDTKDGAKSEKAKAGTQSELLPRSYNSDVPDSVHFSCNGTPGYASPEIVMRQGHSEETDFWSLGCISYELFTGSLPFSPGKGMAELLDSMLANKIVWHDMLCIGDLSKDLVGRLLRVEPSQRLGRRGASEVQEHAFFEGIVWDKLFTGEGCFVPTLDSSQDTFYFSDDRKGDDTTVEKFLQAIRQEEAEEV